MSPDDRQRYLLDKIGEYLDAGVQVVWVLDPGARTASVYRSMTDVHTLREQDDLAAPDVVPGFRCLLSEVL